MEKIERYKNLTERSEKIVEAEAQHLRMLHDNFDPDWSPGDEPHGTLTFTDEPASVAPTGRDLWAEIDELKARVEKLEKK